MNPCKEIQIREPNILEAIKRKREFIERYGAAYAQPLPPLNMRLVYNDVCQRNFVAGNAVELVFNLFSCCQELLDEYSITEEPESIELQVYREPWRHPRAESRVHPRAGKWIPIMRFKVQEETPFFSFEELELAHQEIWVWVPEYARRKLNPCGELPLVQQKLGTFLPMQ